MGAFVRAAIRLLKRVDDQMSMVGFPVAILSRVGIDRREEQFVAVCAERRAGFPPSVVLRAATGAKRTPHVEVGSVVILIDDFIFRHVQIDVVRGSPVGFEAAMYNSGCPPRCLLRRSVRRS